MALFKSYVLGILLLLLISPAVGQNNCTADINNIYAIPGDSDNIPNISENWVKVKLPDNWHTRWPNHIGGVWYRIDWQLSCKENFFGQSSLALTIDRITMAGKAYINHDLIWQDNSLVEPISRSWNKPVYLPLSPSSIQIGDNYTYIYVVGFPSDSPGLGNIALGNSSYVLNTYEKSIWSQRTIFIINICLSITLGFICFCIWLFRKQEYAFGWFSLCTIFWSGFIYNILTTETWPLPDSYTFMQVNIIFFLGYIYCFCIFTWRFLHKTYPRTERTFLILNILFIIAIILSSSHFLVTVITIAFYVNFFIFIINLITVIYLSFRTSRLENWLLASATFGCLILCCIDLLSLLNIISPTASILPYSSIFMAVFVTITLSLHLTRSLNRIEQFNKELNQKIIETSNDLKISLEKQYELALKNNQLQTRLKLSYELHDGLGSTLTHAIASVNHNQKHNLNKLEVLAMLKTLNSDLRKIVDLFKGNHQPLPQTPILWLAPLRHRFNTLFNELSIKAIWKITPEWQHKPNWQICSILYRVLEEALSNVIKHSQANLIEISYEYIDKSMILKIQDNGIGFDVESVFNSGVSIGLQSIKSRIEELNGTLVINSKTHQTTIMILIEWL